MRAQKSFKSTTESQCFGGEAFGFEVQMVDGHDVAALVAALSARSDRPRCIIANTVKGKGVSYMENVAKWHHGVPNDAEFAQAMAELV